MQTGLLLRRDWQRAAARRTKRLERRKRIVAWMDLGPLRRWLGGQPRCTRCLRRFGRREQRHYPHDNSCRRYLYDEAICECRHEVHERCCEIYCPTSGRKPH
jgi:hypothetical protein